MSAKIFPWNAKSRGANELAKELGIRRIKRDGTSSFKGSPETVVINWGAGEIDNPEVLKCIILNDPKRVAMCTNKLHFLNAMSVKNGPRIPDFTADPNVAHSWFKKDQEVVARMRLQGHSGTGILFFSDFRDNLEEVLKAPLFTRYIKKKDEFRVHIFRGEVIDIQKKMLRLKDDKGIPIDKEKIDTRVRNLVNGYIFGRLDITVPKDVPEQALRAFERSGLDFGAVDVLWNEHYQQAYVLEINTAPGLEGTTLKNYSEEFRKLI